MLQATKKGQPNKPIVTYMREPYKLEGQGLWVLRGWTEKWKRVIPPKISAEEAREKSKWNPKTNNFAQTWTSTTTKDTWRSSLHIGHRRGKWVLLGWTEHWELLEV